MQNLKKLIIRKISYSRNVFRSYIYLTEFAFLFSHSNLINSYKTEVDCDLLFLWG